VVCKASVKKVTDEERFLDFPTNKFGKAITNGDMIKQMIGIC